MTETTADRDGQRVRCIYYGGGPADGGAEWRAPDGLQGGVTFPNHSQPGTVHHYALQIVGPGGCVFRYRGVQDAPAETTRRCCGAGVAVCLNPGEHLARLPDGTLALLCSYCRADIERPGG